MKALLRDARDTAMAVIAIGFLAFIASCMATIVIASDDGGAASSRPAALRPAGCGRTHGHRWPRESPQQVDCCEAPMAPLIQPQGAPALAVPW